MKKITLLLSGLLMSTLAINAQDVIVDQPVDTAGSALISFEGNDDIGVYCADDFELTETTILGELDIFGRLSNVPNFENLTGLNVIIYADDAGAPAGNPSVADSGLVELRDIPSSSFTLTEDGAGISDFISIKLTEANGGSQISLDAGTYWVCVYPSVDEAFATGGTNRWNWTGSSAANTGTEPLLIDPFDQFGAGATDWSNISGLINAAFPSFGMTLRNEEPLSIDDASLTEGISVYPNPTNGDLNINVTRDFGQMNIVVTNVAGQTVMTSQIEGTSNTINTSRLAAGIYFAEVSTETADTVIKFVKN